MISHPDSCPVCHGTDWDDEHDVPCRDASHCGATLDVGSGIYVCGLTVDHPGPHRSGAVEWQGRDQ